MITIDERLEMAMNIADNLKANDTLSGNTIYDLCLHISKAQEQVKNLTIPVVIDSNIINNRCECQEYDPVDVKLCANCDGYCE